MREALSYLRVSGKGQVDGDGFPRQRDAVERFAAGNEIQIIREFRDEGISGTRELEDREGLASLLEAVESTGVKLVLVENASRLARDLLVQETILYEFRKKNVVVLTSEGLDLSVIDGDPTRVLIRQIFGAIWQFEKAMLVLKLRSARERKRRREGRCEGPMPYGHTEEERRIVQQIVAMREQGLKLSLIADQLNLGGVPSRRGQRWSLSTIHKILRRADPRPAARSPSEDELDDPSFVFAAIPWQSSDED